jgi:hypothetical protein
MDESCEACIKTWKGRVHRPSPGSEVLCFVRTLPEILARKAGCFSTHDRKMARACTIDRSIMHAYACLMFCVYSWFSLGKTFADLYVYIMGIGHAGSVHVTHALWPEAKRLPHECGHQWLSLVCALDHTHACKSIVNHTTHQAFDRPDGWTDRSRLSVDGEICRQATARNLFFYPCPGGRSRPLMMAVRRGGSRRDGGKRTARPHSGRAKAGDRFANTDTCEHTEEKGREQFGGGMAPAAATATATVIGTYRTRKGAPDRDKTAPACVLGLSLALGSRMPICYAICAVCCVWSAWLGSPRLDRPCFVWKVVWSD